MIYANGAYTYRKLVYENTRAQVYTIMAKVEDLPGYVEGETPVVFSGDFTDSNFTYHNDLIRLYEEGETGLSGSSITYDGTIKWWFGNIMGSAPKWSNTQAELWPGPKILLCRPCPVTPPAAALPWWMVRL